MPGIYQLLLWLFDEQRLLVFVLILSRISGLLAVAPVYGTRDVPLAVRAFLAFTLALVCLPTQWHMAVPGPETLLNFLTYIGHEVAIGLAIGLAVRIFFTAFELAGQAISQTAGLSLSEVFFPTLGTSATSLSMLLYWIALAIYLALGGHRLVLGGFLETFDTLPLGQSAAALIVPEVFHALVSASFELGFRIAAPAVTALLLATLVTALLSRTVPQLNMTLGLGVNAILVLGVLMLSLGTMAYACADELESAMTAAFEILRAPTN
jgi:flagellar biosynthetic protein FliR